MTQFRYASPLLPGDTIPIQKAESGHVPQAVTFARVEDNERRLKTCDCHNFSLFNLHLSIFNAPQTYG